MIQQRKIKKRSKLKHFMILLTQFLYPLGIDIAILS